MWDRPPDVSQWQPRSGSWPSGWWQYCSHCEWAGWSVNDETGPHQHWAGWDDCLRYLPIAIGMAQRPDSPYSSGWLVCGIYPNAIGMAQRADFPYSSGRLVQGIYPLPLGWPKGQIPHTQLDGLFKVFTHCHWDGLKSGFPMFIEIDCMRYLPSNLTNLKCICLEIFRHILNCTI